MTTVPSMARPLSARRMASTAAWSAAFSSPRPISIEAESAAASVTRTTSSARLRSIVIGLAIAHHPLLPTVAIIIAGRTPSLPAARAVAKAEGRLQRLDPDHVGRLHDRVQTGDAGERAAHRGFLGLEIGRAHV